MAKENIEKLTQPSELKRKKSNKNKPGKSKKGFSSNRSLFYIFINCSR